MSSRKARRLTKAELRALGARPGLMARRVAPDGRTCLKQLTAEASRRAVSFSPKTSTHEGGF